MKRVVLKILILLSLTTTTNLISQNYIYYGDKQYKSTKTWAFGTFGKIELNVAKDKEKGILMVSKSSFKQLGEFKGTLFIFLINGEVIKCVETGIKDYVDNKYISLYKLTPEEVNFLKKFRISQIRYSVSNNFEGKKSYTAKNVKSILAIDEMFDKDGNRRYDTLNYYETDKEVRILFNNY